MKVLKICSTVYRGGQPSTPPLGPSSMPDTAASQHILLLPSQIQMQEPYQSIPRSQSEWAHELNTLCHLWYKEMSTCIARMKSRPGSDS